MMVLERAKESKNRRALTARWIVTVEVQLLTAALIGSHEADNCDMTFERDIRGRLPLHGTTIAGALRNIINDHLLGYRNKQDAADVLELFGDLDKHESPLIVFDTASEQTAVPAAIRDGVRIEPATSTASDGLKYDRELALPDLRFPLRFDLLVGEGMDETRLLNALLLALDALCPAPHRWTLHLGARRTRGLGEMQRVPDSFRAVRFDLTTPAGWKDFARSAYGLTPLASQAAGATTPQAALKNAWAGFQISEMPDARKHLSIRCTFQLASTLLIRSPGQQPDSADAIHLTEQGRQIFSGTSFVGVLRGQCNRIINTLNPSLNPHSEKINGDQGTLLLDSLFGVAPERVRSDNPPTGSRLFVSEAAIEGGKVHRQTRVKIDRFTGGAIDTALFDEEPAVGGEVTFHLWVQNPSDAETALVLFALRDVLEGMVAFGGGVAGGRGILIGDAQVQLSGKTDTFALASIANNAEMCRQLNGYAAQLKTALTVGETKGEQQ